MSDKITQCPTCGRYSFEDEADLRQQLARMDEVNDELLHIRQKLETENAELRKQGRQND